jgi:hypothetical protein
MINLNARQSNQFITEIRKARESRAAGLHGRMRVCVRRAASVLTEAWMESNSMESPFSDVYRTFSFLLTKFEGNTEIQTILTHLTTRVDENYQIPEPVDFLDEVYRLAHLLEIELPEVE